MKILSFKNNSVQENNTISNTVAKIESRPINPGFSQSTQEIKLKNFSDTIAKLKVENELDVATIERLKNELSSNSITSEKLADAMIDYVKNNQWNKRV